MEQEKGVTHLPVRSLRVTAADEAVRLDRFLQAQMPGVPPSAIQRMMRTGQVRVNGGRVEGKTRLHAGDELRLPPVRLVEEDRSGQRVMVPPAVVALLRPRILWRDNTLLVLDKPAGMAVHGGSNHPWGVVDAMRLLLAATPGSGEPELCHRLDQETSGCLLFALDKPTVRSMADKMRRGEMEKEYLGLIKGEPHPWRGVIREPLVKGVSRGGERMVVAGEEGKTALTRYQLLERFGWASLAQLRLGTGRTHQIRAHLHWLGHPLAGDGKYGEWEFNRQMKRLGLKRMFLHAHRIAFSHPHTGERIDVTAPLEEALQAILAQLAKGKADLAAFSPSSGG